MRHRGDLKFAIFPAYLTEEPKPFLVPFEDRLFIWEHRHWQAVDMDRHMVESWAERCSPPRADPGGTTRVRLCWPSASARGSTGPNSTPRPTGPASWRRNRPSRARLGASGRLRALALRPDDADPRRPWSPGADLRPARPRLAHRALQSPRRPSGATAIPPPVQSMEEFEDGHSPPDRPGSAKPSAAEGRGHAGAGRNPRRAGAELSRGVHRPGQCASGHPGGVREESVAGAGALRCAVPGADRFGRAARCRLPVPASRPPRSPQPTS